MKAHAAAVHATRVLLYATLYAGALGGRVRHPDERRAARQLERGRQGQGIKY